MQKIAFFVLMMILSGCGPAQADNYGPSNSNSNDPALNQAKSEYKTYLEQLKAMSAQYKQVTGEVKKVLKEEGVPTWDEEEGGIKMVEYKDEPPAAASVVSAVSVHGYGKADIRETDREVVVRVDMPGFSKNDIKLRVRNGRELWINAVRRNELGEFPFERVITLPASADQKSTQGQYQNGVLTVRFAKLSTSGNEVSIPIR